AWVADSLPTIAVELLPLSVGFDELWLSDPSRNQLSSILLPRRQDRSTDSSSVGTLVQQQIGSKPIVLVYREATRCTLLFVQPIRGHASAKIIAVVSSDSLTGLLERQQRPSIVSIVVTSSSGD